MIFVYKTMVLVQLTMVLVQLTCWPLLPLVPTRSPRHAERSRSTPWRRPELGNSRRHPAGSSVVQAGPEPSPWWYHPSEPPGWGGGGGREVSKGKRKEGRRERQNGRQKKRKERLIRDENNDSTVKLIDTDCPGDNEEQSFMNCFLIIIYTSY